MDRFHSQRGFSLFEMLIVIVLIAILVGAIMVARDLINSSRIRGAVGQIESFNAAVGAFRNKYPGLPGDLLNSKAVSYGLTAQQAGSYIAGYGDGNGSVQSAITMGPSRVDLMSGEITLFWKQLSETHMIGDGLDAATSTDTQLDAASEADDYERWLPRMTIRGGVYAYAFGHNGHYYYLAKFHAQTGPSIATATTDGLTQWEAKSIDEKLDDGLPTTGRIIAVRDMGMDGPQPDDGSVPAASVCVDGTVSPKAYYELGFIDHVACRLQVKANY